jgi:ankyrin repeat protein
MAHALISMDLPLSKDARLSNLRQRYQNLTNALIYLDANDDDLISTICDKIDVHKVYPDGTTLLMKAAKNGKEKSVIELCSRGVDVNAQDLSGRTTLMHIAWRSDCLAIVKVLLAAYAQVDYRDPCWHTVLYEASSSDVTFETCKILLEYKADPNIPTIDGDTPLLRAARQNASKTCSLLLEYKADTAVKNNAKMNGLHYAVINKNTFLCDLFIKNGVDVNAVDKKGFSPLLYSLSGESINQEVYTILLAHKADISIVHPKEKKTALELLSTVENRLEVQKFLDS